MEQKSLTESEFKSYGNHTPEDVPPYNSIKSQSSQIAEYSEDSDANIESILCARHKTFKLPCPTTLNIEIGRTIGHDFGKYGMRLPDDAPISVLEGFQSFHHKFKNKPHPPQIFTRKWMRLRYSAWRRNRIFDESVTPDLLSEIYTDICPITRTRMTFGTGTETDASVDRVYNDSAYAAGNLAFMSVKANLAKANRTLDEILYIADSNIDHEGLSNIEWCRLASLCNVLQPDSEYMKILPMYVLPPARLVIGNPSVILQESISLTVAGQANRKILTYFRKITPGKANKKTFDELIYIFRASLLRTEFTDDMHSIEQAIEDCWSNTNVFTNFANWYQSLPYEKIVEMLQENVRLRKSTIKRSSDTELNSWHMGTRGYDK